MFSSKFPVCSQKFLTFPVKWRERSENIIIIYIRVIKKKSQETTETFSPTAIISRGYPSRGRREYLWFYSQMNIKIMPIKIE